jgi:hypothetical protein
MTATIIILSLWFYGGPLGQSRPFATKEECQKEVATYQAKDLSHVPTFVSSNFDFSGVPAAKCIQHKAVLKYEPEYQPLIKP